MKKRFQKFDGLILASLDIASLILAGFLSEWADNEASFYRYTRSHFEIVYTIFIFIPIVVVFDLYYPLRDFRSYRSMVRLLVAVCLFAAIMFAIDALRSFIGHPVYHDGGQLLSFFSLLLLFCFSGRAAMSFLRKQMFVRNAIIIGNTEAARLLMDCIEEEQQAGRHLSFRILGYVAEHGRNGPLCQLPHLGRPEQLPELRKAHNLSLMVYALDTFANAEINELIVHERLQGVPLISAVGLYEAITGRVPHRHINTTWLIEECLRSNRFAQVNIKNLMDRVLGLLLLLLSLPILLVCGYLIKRESPGPALFTQQRIGQLGKPFTIYKLRTMRQAEGAESVEAEGWHDQQESRITPLGRLLRRTHIDELPQLFNVVKGDMSLVGPRPEMEIFIQACENKIPFYRLRLDVKPGITGWAQVAYRHTSTLEAYQQKFEYELHYLSHLSLRFDLEILARTFFVLFLKPSR